MTASPRSIVRRAADAILSNAAYKILSVLIALSLWFIVRDERVETTVTYALDLQPPADLVVGNETVPEIAVVVVGTRVSLDRLRRGPLVLPIKLKASEPGILALHPRPEDVPAPPGVQVMRVAPATIGVRLETRRSRVVPVRPRLVLEDEASFRVRKVGVVPDRVRISGPASVVAAVEQVWTEAIVIPAKSGETITGSYAISLPHPQLRTEDAPSVAVTVELEEKVAESAASPSPKPAKTHSVRLP